MSVFEDRLFNLGNLITAGASVYQAAGLHKSIQSHEDELHQQELKLLREQHKKELFTAKQTYLLTTFTELEQYCQELNENLLSSSRDAERDMVDQRNQQFQTILLAASIMLTALICVLIQGVLPDSSSTFLVISYSLSNALSLVTLSLTILLCVEITFRVSKFMYKKSITNIEHLSEAMLHTSEVMKNLRGDTWLTTSKILNENKSAENTEALKMAIGPGSFTRQFTMAAQELLPHKQHSRGSVSGSPSRQNAMRARTMSEASKYSDSKIEVVTDPTVGYKRPSLVKSISQPVVAPQPSVRPSLAKHKQRSHLSMLSHASTTSSGGSTARYSFFRKSHSNKQVDLKTDFISAANTNKEDYYENMKKRQKITLLDEKDVDIEWGAHEQQIQEYFSTRDKINEKMELLAVANDILDGDNANAKRVSFELFWKENCHALSNLALLLFYLGTSAMLWATMIYMYLQFTVVYADNTAAYCGVATIGLSLVVCLALALYLRYFDYSVIMMREKMEGEILVEKAGIMRRLTQLVSSVWNRRFARHSQVSFDTADSTLSTIPPIAAVGPAGLTLDIASINNETNSIHGGSTGSGDEIDGAAGPAGFAGFSHFNDGIRTKTGIKKSV